MIQSGGEYATFCQDQQTRIYPYPMVWPLPRPWSETMVSIPPLSAVNPMHKRFSVSGAPFCGFGLADPAQGVGVDPCLLTRGRHTFAKVSR